MDRSKLSTFLKTTNQSRNANFTSFFLNPIHFANELTQEVHYSSITFRMHPNGQQRSGNCVLVDWARIDTQHATICVNILPMKQYNNNLHSAGQDTWNARQHCKITLRLLIKSHQRNQLTTYKNVTNNKQNIGGKHDRNVPVAIKCKICSEPSRFWA